MSKISTTLAISLMIVVGILGWLAGYASTPEYRAGMYDKTAMDLGRPDRTLDLRYINAMITHHRAAMLLASQANRETQRADIRDLREVLQRRTP
jgi:uncharacterized protein (DUF305 family)